MRPSFYIAGKYSERENLNKIASQLRGAGYYVNAEWLEGSHSGGSVEDQKKYAEADLRDIRNSTYFLFVNNADVSSGRNIEFGFAHANSKRIFILGTPTSVFHQLAHSSYDTIEDFLRYAKKNLC